MSSPYAGRHRNAPASRLPGTSPRPVLDARPRPAPSRRDRRGRPGGRRHHRRRLPVSDRHQTEQAGFTVSAQAIEQANEQSDLQIENDAQLASARSDANARRLPSEEKDRRDRLAAEAAAAGGSSGGRGAPPARRSARPTEAKRDAIIARAKDDPRAAARVLLPVRLGRQPVLLPRQPLGGRERLELPGREPPPAPTASRSRCRVRRWPASPRLAREPGHPDHVGPAVHPEATTAAPAVHGHSGRAAARTGTEAPGVLRHAGGESASH